MKFAAFWLAVMCASVWAAVVGLEYVSQYQAKQLFENNCVKTGAVATTWNVIPIQSGNMTTFIPVPTEQEEYFCKVTGESVWRVK